MMILIKILKNIWKNRRDWRIALFFFCKNLSQNFYNIFQTDPLVEKQYFTRFFFISHKLKLVYVISRIDAVHQRRSRLREFSINNFSRDKRRKEGGEENNLGACQAKLHRQCSCALSMNIIFPIRVTFSPLIEINQKRDLDEFYSPSPLNRLFHFHWKIYIYIYISVSSTIRVVYSQNSCKVVLQKTAHHAMKANEKDQNVSILEFTT